MASRKIVRVNLSWSKALDDIFLDTMDYWQGVLSRLKEDSRYEPEPVLTTNYLLSRPK